MSALLSLAKWQSTCRFSANVLQHLTIWRSKNVYDKGKHQKATMIYFCQTKIRMVKCNFWCSWFPFKLKWNGFLCHTLGWYPCVSWLAFLMCLLMPLFGWQIKERKRLEIAFQSIIQSLSLLISFYILTYHFLSSSEHRKVYLRIWKELIKYLMYFYK